MKFTVGIFYFTENPTKMLDLSAYLSLFLSAIITGLILTRNKENTLITYVLTSLSVFLVIFVGALFSDTKIFSFDFLIRLLVPFLMFLGHFFRKMKKKNPKKRYKR